MKHSADPLQSPASQHLREFLRARRHVWQQGVPDFEQFERELHEQIMNLERECLAEEWAHTMMWGRTASRWAGRPISQSYRRQRLICRPPSRSTLDRLPRTLSAHWEAPRAPWEAAEPEWYPPTAAFFNKIATGALLGATSFYALQEVHIFAIDNAPDFPLGAAFGKAALEKILALPILLLPFVSRTERKLLARKFTALRDATDVPHAIAASVYGCDAIVGYDEHSGQSLT